MKQPTALVIELWEAAQTNSDSGRFHEAILGFERVKCILDAGTSDDDKMSRIMLELVDRVSKELTDHYALLEGNFYVTLGVHARSPSKDIKRAYRAFAIRYHPDKTIALGINSSSLFACGKNAFEALSNESRRAAYQPKVLPSDWLRRRAVDTERTVVGTSKPQPRPWPETKKDAPRQTPTSSTKEGDKNYFQPQGGRTANNEAKVSDVKKTESSQRNQAKVEPKAMGTTNWKTPKEVSMMKAIELAAQLESVGMGKLTVGAERRDLEMAYLAARSEALKKRNGESRRSDGSKSEGTTEARAQAESKPIRFGGRVTKDDLKRLEARMFGAKPWATGENGGRGASTVRDSSQQGAHTDVSDHDVAPSWARPKGRALDDDDDEGDEGDGEEELGDGRGDDRRAADANDGKVLDSPDTAPSWGRPNWGLMDEDEDEDGGLFGETLEDEDGDSAWEFAFDVGPVPLEEAFEFVAHPGRPRDDAGERNG
jgi:curved DNA-binding protein CbpA